MTEETENTETEPATPSSDVETQSDDTDTQSGETGETQSDDTQTTSGDETPQTPAPGSDAGTTTDPSGTSGSSLS